MDDDKLQIEARYEGGRWVADVPQIPGCRVQGDTREEAIAKGKARALRAIADGVERGAIVDTADCLFEEGDVRG
jgi:predicted RNase H-like HicB family nuclease